MSEEFVEDIINNTKQEDLQVNQDTIIIEDPPKEDVKEENKEVKEEKVVDDPPKEEKVIDPDEKVKELAIKIGWNPDYKADDAVDAATFILKSREIQDTMKANTKDLKGQLSNLQSTVEALQNHNERVFKAELKQKEAEIAKLKKEKLAAVELADVKKVTEIDEQIEDIQKDLNTIEKPNVTTTDNPIFDEWIKDNQWYLLDDEMASYAEFVAKQYAGGPPEQVFKRVREKVEDLFPEKFKKPKKVETTTTEKEVKKEKPVGPASPVEPSTKTTTGQKFTEADLTHDQVNIMRQFVSAGIMTKEQYINDIAKLQEA